MLSSSSCLQSLMMVFASRRVANCSPLRSSSRSLGVERFDPAVLPGASGFGDHQRDVAAFRPVGDDTSNELRTIVETQISGCSFQIDESFRSGDEHVGGDGTFNVGGQDLAGELVDDVQPLRPSAVWWNWKSIAHNTFEQIGQKLPTTTGPLGARLRLRAGTRSPSPRHRRRTRLRLTRQPCLRSST